MAKEAYTPRGFMVVAIKEQVCVFPFDNRAEWNSLFLWLEEVKAKPLLGELDNIVTVTAALQVAEAIRKIDPPDIYKTDDTPVCAKHRTPMKQSANDIGGWYCPRKDRDGFCKNHITSKGKVVNEK